MRSTATYSWQQNRMIGWTTLTTSTTSTTPTTLLALSSIPTAQLSSLSSATRLQTSLRLRSCCPVATVVGILVAASSSLSLGVTAFCPSSTALLLFRGGGGKVGSVLRLQSSSILLLQFQKRTFYTERRIFTTTASNNRIMSSATTTVRRSNRLQQQQQTIHSSSTNHDNHDKDRKEQPPPSSSSNQPRASRKRSLQVVSTATTTFGVEATSDNSNAVTAAENEPPLLLQQKQQPTKSRSVSNAKKGQLKKEPISNDAPEPETTASKKVAKDNDNKGNKTTNCLARTRELQLIKKTATMVVMGIDEAGRGPLAGPVVAAAVILPTNVDGVVDSKAILLEADREQIYQDILQAIEDDQTKTTTMTQVLSKGRSTATNKLLPTAGWAVAIVDAATIDQVNILQATMLAMTMAAHALMGVKDATIAYAESASVQRQGCYVVRNVVDRYDQQVTINDPAISGDMGNIAAGISNNVSYYALVDGNRVPSQLSCGAEAIIKGDSKEFCIAAASILAKVTRDRLMNEYHHLYPQYNFAQHKGYPTKAHRQLLTQEGPCPIHRRTFSPLKQQLLEQDAQPKREGET